MGASFLGIAETAGGMALLFGRIVSRLARLSCDRPELWRNLHRMGVKSLPIVVVTALFTGAIMVIQASPIVERYGAQQLLGWAAGFGTLREIGPLLTALMISGRVGANNTAELGTMVVTEQVDALRMSAADPIEYLVVPRFLASLTMTFCLLIWAGFVAFGAGMITANVVFEVNYATFANFSLVDAGDLSVGLAKCVAYGAAIPIVSARCGLTTFGGSEGVGWATTNAVVQSSLAVIVLNFLISSAGYLIFPG